MLDKAKTLFGYKLCTGEGDIGKLKEFYFDYRHSAIRDRRRHRSWLAGRQVLISPYGAGCGGPGAPPHRPRVDQAPDRG